ncbi:MAG: hypothetical protein K6F56_09455 [Oscillospiraceae bacterium]|nr:hypothetical protein [Oscillospiraceae bacterium]
MEAERTEQSTAGESRSFPGTGPAAAQAENTQTDSPPAAQKRLSWEEILADPDYRKSYDEAVGRTVQRKLRSRAEAEQRLSALEPVLQALRERYGEQDETRLAEQIRYGESPVREEEIRRHLEDLFEQAGQLRALAPDFDLLRALEDPAFLRLTAPHSGVSPEDAWYALHREQIGAEAARRSLEALSRSVRSQAARPRENHGGAAGTDLVRDPKSMSRQEREELKKRILEAKAQGRKIPVGE